MMGFDKWETVVEHVYAEAYGLLFWHLTVTKRAQTAERRTGKQIVVVTNIRKMLQQQLATSLATKRRATST